MAAQNGILFQALKSTHKSWRSILIYDAEKLTSTFEHLQELINLNEKIIPDVSNIFEFAKIPLSNVKIVIIGQDPYETPEHKAHGIAFSAMGEVCPKSLGRIFNVIEHNKLFHNNIPTNNNLSSWNQQGILMINSSLTVKPYSPKSHKNLWKDYITGMIKTLDIYFKLKAMNVHWLLWGKDAQSLSPCINYGTKLTWCHPVAMKSPSFIKCPHFQIVSEIYPNLWWDTDECKEIVHWYTDGACKNNQFADKATAGWGFTMMTKLRNVHHEGSGNVLSARVKYKGKIIDARPTSQRAEGLALLNCIKCIYYSGIRAQHIINTDSQFWMNMLEEWMEKWVNRQLSWDEHKNSDITYLLYNWWIKLNKFTSVTLRKVQAHHDYSRPQQIGQEQMDHDGNRIAEEYAEAGI